MTDSKLHEAECIEGPCGVSASRSLEPSIRNAFVIKRFVFYLLVINEFWLIINLNETFITFIFL